jgi:glycosyltransferase involved in cell wall biosynthesis
MEDLPIDSLCGQRFFRLPRPGTWQLAEVGFVLRDGEFIPAARSVVVPFSPHAPSPHGGHAALLVDSRRRVEEIGNLWDQEKILRERRKPKLRQPLRIASFALAAKATGQQGALAQFVSELAAGQAARGHEAHVFVPANGHPAGRWQVDGVHYESLAVDLHKGPLEIAQDFAKAAEARLRECGEFDLFHLHEWMTGRGAWIGARPAILSLTSIEKTRRNGTSPSPLSLQIEQVECDVAQAVDCVLTPDWLQEKARAEFGIDNGRLHAFAMEGRLPNEWEQPLDYGQVKKEIAVGPLDRLLLFIGPLEHGAGVDLLIEAMPVLLQRAGNLRLAFIGDGNMHGQLYGRAMQLGVAHAVRLLGHIEGPFLTRLLRASEALVLPSRYRMAFDDAVVDLARRAAKPIITTQGGPAHLVRHEETGIVTYDNPGSMVWAVDRILGDPGHAERMGQVGRRTDSTSCSWSEVARQYLDLCAARFPELRIPDW